MLPLACWGLSTSQELQFRLCGRMIIARMINTSMNRLSQRPQNAAFRKNTPNVSCINCQKEMGVNAFVRHSEERCIYWQKQNGLLTLGKRGAGGGWNKGLSKLTNNSVRQASETYTRRHKEGRYKNRKCSSNEKQDYRNKCAFKFNVFNYPDHFTNLDLITTVGWYHPITNPDGISRDHIISIAYGWKNKIDPAVMSHLENCQLLFHTENNKKKTKCSMHIDELVEKINMSQWLD